MGNVTPNCNDNQSTVMKFHFQINISAWRIAPVLAFALSVAIEPAARAGTEHWTGAGADENWTTSGNWTGIASPQTYFNDVDFTDFGGTTTLTDFSVNNIFPSATGIAQCPIYQLRMYPTNRNFTTLISPGVALYTGAGAGDLYVGADTITASRGYANIQETVSFTGPGALLAITGTLHVGQGFTNTTQNTVPPSTNYVTLNMSGLDTFVMAPSISGGTRFNGTSVGNTATGTAASRFLLCGQIRSYSQGAIYLAKTNLITLGNDMEIGAMSVYSNSMPCPLYLGIYNSVLVGNNGAANGLVTIGSRGNTNAFVTFNPAFLGGATPPVASFASPPTINGGRVTTFYVCRSDGGSIPAYGYADFTGGNVNIMASTMQVGYAGSSGINASGVLTFDNGLVNVNYLTNGNQTVSGGGTGVGVINVNSNATYGAAGILQVNNTLVLGGVASGGTLTPGTAGTVNVNGGTLSANAVLNGLGTGTINLTNASFSLNSTAGTPAAPINNFTAGNATLQFSALLNATNAVVTTLATGGTNVINIALAPPLSSIPAVFKLIKYSGSIGGAGYNFTLGALPPLCLGYLSNDTLNASVDLVLTNGPLGLTWDGVVSGDWDTITTNWFAAGPELYADGDYVTFPDGATTSTVNLTATFAPGGTTVTNNALEYIFTGGGAIGGTGSLVKQGTNTLILDNSGINSFSGGINITGGALQVGNNDTSGNLPAGAVADASVLVFDRQDNITVPNNISGTGSLVQGGGGTVELTGASTFSGPVLATNNSTLQLGSGTGIGVGNNSLTIANGSTLDANGYTCIKPIVVSGTGVGGNGAIIDSGGAIYDNPGPGLATNIMLAGDTTFTMNSPSRWDLGSAAGGNVLGALGAYNLTLNGNGYFEWRNLTVQSPLANITIASGTLGAVGTTSFGNPAATLFLTSGTTLQFYGPSVYVNKQVDFQNGANIINSSGTNIMNGAMTLEPGYCTFTIGNGTTLVLSNVLSSSGIFYQSGGSGTTILAGNSPAFTGGVDLYLGSVVLRGTIGCGITNQPGTVISGTGTADSSLDVSGTVTPGGTGVAGTLTTDGDLVLEPGAMVTNNLVSATTIGGGVNSLLQVNGNVSVNGNTLYVNPLAPLANGATYTLITYTGTLSGTLGGAVTVPPYVLTLTNVTTTSPKRIGVIVSGGSSSALAWNNASGNGEWDVDVSPNWTNLTTGLSSDYFFSFDPVLFLDSITNSPTPTTSIDIAAGQIVIPTVLTNNSTTNYTISGAGKISGLASIVKQGASTLTLDTTNDFTGSVTIQGGTLKAGVPSSLGGTAGTVYVTNAATLDLIYSTGNKPLVISGTGVSGLGALVNNDTNGTPIYDNPGGVLNLTLAGNATIGGTNRMDFGQISPAAGVLGSGGSNYNLTVVGPAYREWDNVAFDTNFGNINVMTTSGGAVGIKGTTTLGNPTNTLSVFSNAVVTLYQDSASQATVTINKKVLLYGGSTFGNGGSSNVIISPVVLGLAAGDLCTNNIGGTSLTISNVVSGPGSLVKTGSSPLDLTATNTFTGNTVLSSGTVALIGTGSIATSPAIVLTAGATVDVNSRTDQTLTLAAGQTLQGSGAVNGTLASSASSTVSPGTSAATGTLIVSTNATLSGTALFKLNGATNDVLAAGRTLTYGGTLVLTNLSASPLTATNSFKLFSAGSYAGAFSSIVAEPPLAAGLTWNTNGLTVNGTISIVSAAQPIPRITSIRLSGMTLTITATNGTAGGTYVLLETTNLAVPISHWTPVLTNSFDGSGDLNLSTNIINPNNAQEFYILAP